MVPFDGDFTGGCTNWKTGFQVIPPDFDPKACMRHGELGSGCKRPLFSCCAVKQFHVIVKNNYLLWDTGGL